MYFTVVAGAFSNAIRQAKISDGLNGTYGPNIVMMIDIYGSNLETTVLSQVILGAAYGKSTETINVLKSHVFWNVSFEGRQCH